MQLLNRIMDQQNIEHSPIVRMFEAFTCQVGQLSVVHCIVLEHLEISLADLLSSTPRPVEHLQTLDYSLSDASPTTEMKNDSGLSLEFVKKIGW